MPSTSTSSHARTTTQRRTRATTPDAVRLLKADHAEVKKLFDQYEKLAEKDGRATERQKLAQQICMMLTVHAQIEEEIFYPAARELLDEQDLVDEAAVEHASAKDLIAQIESMSPEDDLYDAKVTVLGEYIQHHVKEEEKELFPKVRKAGLDMKDVGQQLQQRKDKLMAETTRH